jgi:acyl dehydratase
MPTTRLESPAALAQHIGQAVAVGDWLAVGPERVQRFADATDDHQWIHLDATRAAAESPYGGPIAHGRLTLSLIVPLVQQAVDVGGVGMTVNYGFDKVRFPAAVPVGARAGARRRRGGRGGEGRQHAGHLARDDRARGRRQARRRRRLDRAPLPLSVA